VLERNCGVLSEQVLREFYLQATGSTRPDPIAHDIAAALFHAMTRGFSYWDNAIIAAAGALGCRELYFEDMSHGQQIDGVMIVNPFR
jgi:predicted nucleic acid-binding protein